MAPPATDWVKNLQWICTMLWELWSWVRWLMGVASIVLPHNSRNELLRTLRPSSQASYRRALLRWDRWVADRGASPQTPGEYDQLLYLLLRDMSRSEASTTVAALERTIPPLRRQLPWSHGLLQTLQESSTIAHHAPMSWECALLLAFGLLQLRQPGWAAVLLLHRLVGTRPKEILTLRKEHWCPGSLNSVAAGVGLISLGVGTGGTKVRREQCIRIPRHEHFTLQLVELLHRTTAGGAYITSAEHTNSLNARLRRAASLVGVEPCWTGHCARAGWATDLWIQGATIETLMDQGRWKSQESVRTYIDAVAMRATNDLLLTDNQQFFIQYVRDHLDVLFSELPFKPA